MAHTVIGIFDDAQQAQSAIEELVEDGIMRDRIDVSSQSDSSGQMATSGSISSGTTGSASSSGMSGSYSGSSDSMTGSSAYTGSERRSDKDESWMDSVGNFFSGLFGDDDDDNRSRAYSEVGRYSSSIVTVHCQDADEADRAREILDDNGAIDVDERAREYGYSTGSYQSSSGAMDNSRSSDTTSRDMSIPIVEENIQVGKRVVETGGARLRSRIVERPVEESLRLREERVRVERRPVDRPATEADFNTFKEGEIELREHAEVAMVNKEARVVEEVRLGKEVTERQETIHDTVRRTEVDVENLTESERTARRSDTRDESDSVGRGL